MTMSEAAKSALIAAHPRQGAKVATDVGTEWELIDAGLIGQGTGLTRKGTIERMKIVRALEDAAFGF